MSWPAALSWVALLVVVGLGLDSLIQAIRNKF